MMKYSKGQSLFELVVAVAVSALVVVAIVSLVANSIRNATFSKNSALASSYAATTVEWLRSQRDSDVTTFLTNVSVNAPAETVYCFRNLDWSHQGSCSDSDYITGTQIFRREAVFTVTTPGDKTLVQADITVSWTDSQGLHETRNSTYFTDWNQR